MSRRLPPPSRLGSIQQGSHPLHINVGVDDDYDLDSVVDNEPALPAAPSEVLRGLSFQPIPGDGHCLFNAVALYVGQDQQALRNRVADHLEQHPDLWDLLPRRSDQTVEQYIQSIQKREWADHVEIHELMVLLDRPIIIIQSDQDPTIPDNLSSYHGEPIFVFYNGRTHYDAFVLEGDIGSREVLNSIQAALREGQRVVYDVVRQWDEYSVGDYSPSSRDEFDSPLTPSAAFSKRPADQPSSRARDRDEAQPEDDQKEPPEESKEQDASGERRYPPESVTGVPHKVLDHHSLLSHIHRRAIKLNKPELLRNLLGASLQPAKKRWLDERETIAYQQYDLNAKIALLQYAQDLVGEFQSLMLHRAVMSSLPETDTNRQVHEALYETYLKTGYIMASFKSYNEALHTTQAYKYYCEGLIDRGMQEILPKACVLEDPRFRMIFKAVQPSEYANYKLAHPEYVDDYKLKFMSSDLEKRRQDPEVGELYLKPEKGTIEYIILGMKQCDVVTSLGSTPIPSDFESLQAYKQEIIDITSSRDQIPAVDKHFPSQVTLKKIKGALKIKNLNIPLAGDITTSLLPVPPIFDICQ